MTRAYLLFSGTGPLLVLSTYPSITDPQLVAKLGHKGIAKFIAYEVSIERVREQYGIAYEVIAADLVETTDARVLDFNGHHIFSCFSLSELGEPVTFG